MRIARVERRTREPADLPRDGRRRLVVPRPDAVRRKGADAPPDDDADPPTDPGERTGRKRRGAYRSMGRAVMPLRFGVTMLAMLYPFAAHLAGLNDALTVTVLGLAATFLGVDTIRPSGMVRE